MPGVPVEDGSDVDAGGMSVGRDKACLVGGRVEVTKTDLVGEGVSSETLMHELMLRHMMASNSQILFIREFYIANIKIYRPEGLNSAEAFSEPTFGTIVTEQRDYGCAKTSA